MFRWVFGSVWDGNIFFAVRALRLNLPFTVQLTPYPGPYCRRWRCARQQTCAPATSAFAEPFSVSHSLAVTVPVLWAAARPESSQYSFYCDPSYRWSGDGRTAWERRVRRWSGRNPRIEQNRYTRYSTKCAACHNVLNLSRSFIGLCGQATIRVIW